MEETFDSLLCSTVLGKRHHYKELPPVHDCVARHVRLPESAYKPTFSEMPTSFRNIMSYTATPFWYSPKAEDYPLAFADIIAKAFAMMSANAKG